MSSVSGIRLPGLATGMDTENMVKEMLTGEQNKIDKIKQKEQSIKWQQEIYREIINDVKSLNDKYFSVTSKNSIISSSAWSTLTVNSSNENVITAKGGAGASNINYSFEISQLAQPARMSAEFKSKNENLGLSGDISFKIDLGDGENYETIKLGKDDTVETMTNLINDTMKGKVKVSYSEMTGKLTIETKETGSNSKLAIINEVGDATGMLTNIGFDTVDSKGENLKGTVSGDGFKKDLKDQQSNSFTIDGIKYDIYSTTKPGESVNITSRQDVKPVVENMKAFIEDYNKIMDKIYDIVTQKINRDYPPLTEAQKEDMSEDEIERWEKKSKQGILRNDSEMRRFMEDMQKSIFGDKMEVLNSMGLTSHEDYNKKGQIALNEEKFVKALESNSDEVYEIFGKDEKSVLESMKSTINKYVGGSSSIFAKKAGLEKTASAVKNFYSEQLKRQEDAIKKLQRKMDEKENQLYKKFGALEASMNKLNSQMNYFMQA